MFKKLMSSRMYKLVVGAAALAAVLVMGSGQAKPADAATPYTIELSFQSL